MEREIVARLTEWLRTALPAWEAPEVLEVGELNSGWESDVYRVAVSHRATLDQVVLRIYHGASGPAKAAREFQGMRLLHQAGYPVPEVHAVEEDPDVLGRPFLVMDLVPGEQLWTLLDRGSADLFDDFVALLVELHRVDWQPFAAAAVSVPQRLGEWRAMAAAHPVPGFDPVMDWLERRAGNVAATEPAVVHNDFHPANILASEGSLQVIDWTQIEVSDPRFDLAWTLLLTGVYMGEVARSRFLDGYRAGAAPPADLDFFEAAAACKRLYSVVVSVTAGPEAMGMRPEAAAAMRSELRHLDGVHDVLGATTGLSVPEVQALTEQA